MKKLKWLYVLALLPLLWACSGDEDPEITVPAGNEDYFVNSMDFDSAAGSKSFTFSTNGNWTISLASTRSGAEWVTVTPMSGKKGVNTITVAAGSNTEYDDRSVALTLTVGSLSKTVTINQKQLDALTLTKDKFEFDPQGGTFDVEVKANVDYTIDIDPSTQGWITKSARSRGLNTTVTTFKVAASEEYDKREGILTVRSGVKTETIRVYQTGHAILLLSTGVETVSSAGDVVKVDVKSNFNYDIAMPTADWLRECSGARAMSSHTVYFEIDPNDTYVNRTAEIVFKDKQGSLRDTLTIRQMQKDALVVVQPEYTVGKEGGDILLQVGHNVDFDVDITADWITRNESRAYVEELLRFTVAPNETGQVRSAEIHFTNAQKGLSQVVVVNQQDKSVPQTISITHYLWIFKVPTFTPIFGDEVHGTVAWGDKATEDYVAGSTHIYKGESPNVVEVTVTNASAVQLESMEGVTDIDLNKF